VDRSVIKVVDKVGFRDETALAKAHGFEEEVA
jgi:hypothetical protein